MLPKDQEALIKKFARVKLYGIPFLFSEQKKQHAKRQKLFPIYQFRLNLTAKFCMLYRKNASTDWKTTKCLVHKVMQHEDHSKFAKVQRSMIKAVLKKPALKTYSVK